MGRSSNGSQSSSKALLEIEVAMRRNQLGYELTVEHRSGYYAQAGRVFFSLHKNSSNR
jgi:hypothetical protein